MIAFEVMVNGKRLYTISAGELGMLTAEVAWSRHRLRSGVVEDTSWLSGSGLEGDGDALEWPREDIQIGDTITIRVIEIAADTTTPDPPYNTYTAEEMRKAREEGRLPRATDDPDFDP